MDSRDLVIVTQVAFKEACAAERDIDFTDPEGQSRFEQVFSYLTESLINACRATQDPSQQVAQIIQGQFPGTVTEGPGTAQYAQPQYTTPSPPQFGVRVRGNQFGPLPEWLFEQAASKGVTEVYDNRDRVAGAPKRPWFKSTSGGDNAPAFWPPR